MMGIKRILHLVQARKNLSGKSPAADLPHGFPNSFHSHLYVREFEMPLDVTRQLLF